MMLAFHWLRKILENWFTFLNRKVQRQFVFQSFPSIAVSKCSELVDGSRNCENEAFVRDFSPKVKVDDGKTKLSCETSFKSES